MMTVTRGYVFTEFPRTAAAAVALGCLVAAADACFNVAAVALACSVVAAATAAAAAVGIVKYKSINITAVRVCCHVFYAPLYCCCSLAVQEVLRVNLVPGLTHNLRQTLGGM